jgi:hypothetical protein
MDFETGGFEMRGKKRRKSFRYKGTKAALDQAYFAESGPGLGPAVEVSLMPQDSPTG